MKIKTVFFVFLLSSISMMADTIPNAPINIGAYNFTDSSARLSFKDMANNEEGYRVYSEGVKIAEVIGYDGLDSYHYINILGLESCKLYTINLVSFNSVGESSSLTKSFRTIGCNTTTSPTVVNKAPIANAGVDKIITIDTNITLIGKGSDSDGTIVSYQWKNGNTILSETDTFTYYGAKEGVEILTLVVVDNNGSSSSDDIKITTIGVSNNVELPIAPINLGAYNFTNSSARLSFKDMSTNEDGYRVYSKGVKIAEVSAKEGSGEYYYINLLGLDSCKIYTINLVSFNSVGESTSLSKSLKTLGCDNPPPVILNKAPIANAGVDRVVTVGTTLNILGEGSDIDGTVVSYEWKEGDTILSKTSLLEYNATTEGVRTLTLTVTDNNGSTGRDEVQIFINSNINNNTSSITLVDITNFGAIPNDGIDDTEAIKNALSVSGGITMPTGIYNVKELNRIGTTIIDGNGSTFKSERTVVGSSSNILTLKTDLVEDRIEIKNLKLDGDCPTQYPRVGDKIFSLLHIYDSRNILIENLFIQDYSSQYDAYDSSKDEHRYGELNNNHQLDMPHDVVISFSRNINIKNFKQKNIKIEGLLIYESDNINIEDFTSTDSINIWTALHVVASDNIILKDITITDGLVGSQGSSINFFANYYFNISDVNTTHKHAFDISNEVVGISNGRIIRDTSYGTFINCRFEGYHPIQAYPTKNRHYDLKFINVKFIPTRVDNGSYSVRFEKAGELIFDNCIFGSEITPSRFNMIMGDTQKLTIKNSKFINTKSNKSLTSSIYFYGEEYGDINISNNLFNGVNYTPITLFPYGSSKTINEFIFLNNQLDESELEYGIVYRNLGFIINNTVID